MSLKPFNCYVIVDTCSRDCIILYFVCALIGLNSDFKNAIGKIYVNKSIQRKLKSRIEIAILQKLNIVADRNKSMRWHKMVFPDHFELWIADCSTRFLRDPYGNENTLEKWKRICIIASLIICVSKDDYIRSWTHQMLCPWFSKIPM